MTASVHHPFRAKLDPQKAEEIRARHRAGEATRALAREFGVAPSSLHDVVRGRSHRPAVVVHLRPFDLVRLQELARRADLRPEEFAVRCIEQALVGAPHP